MIIETLILCLYLMECNINIIAMSSNEPVIPHKRCYDKDTTKIQIIKYKKYILCMLIFYV